MSLFDSLNHNSSEAVDIGKKYVETTKEYYKLKLFQQTTNAFSFLSKMAVIGGLLFLGLIFMTVSGAIALGNALGSIILSCLIIGAGNYTEDVELSRMTYMAVLRSPYAHARIRCIDVTRAQQQARLNTFCNLH